MERFMERFAAFRKLKFCGATVVAVFLVFCKTSDMTEYCMAEMMMTILFDEIVLFDMMFLSTFFRATTVI
jgi:hypothetical protein